MNDVITSIMEISTEQQQAFDKFKAGENIFITGPGGSGKTHFIKLLVEYAKENNQKHQVCALTGCAAVLLQCGAKTIHSWAGIGLASGPSEKIIQRVCRSRYKKANWNKVDILIIDEVSMMSLKIFNLLNEIGKKTRKNNLRPFGGLQLVFSGDFYQLPPIPDKNDKETEAFCFETPLWNETFPNQIVFNKIYRQTDENYTKILNEIREGKLHKSSYKKLMEYVGRKPNNDAIIKPPILHPKRGPVDKKNSIEMNKLEGEERKYTIKSLMDLPMNSKDKIKNSMFSQEQKLAELQYIIKNIMCDEKIILKIGAQVMCVSNIEMEGPTPICNGSQGIIVDFRAGLPVVRFNNGVEKMMNYHIWESETIPGIGVEQLPLMLSWALTIHKSQGATLDMAEINIGNGIFECGQTYVALSRIKNLEGLYLTSFSPEKIKINRRVQKFYAEF